MKQGCILLVCLIGFFYSKSQSFDEERKIVFPDIPGYRTLKCDFHIHTVFSDGNVWPLIRVEEAARDGLDAISLTEHIEYQPHLEDMPHRDRNRAYQLAAEYAKPYNIIVVNGSEITRDMPPGHANAIFLQDANKLLLEDSIEVYREAKRQGAFIFWNHPDWPAQRGDAIATLTDLHRYLISEGLLNGIEVVNDLTFSDEALQIALDQNLTIMGTSDIHGLVDWQYEIASGGHRPINLVFATEKSEASIKEALENRRTVAWYRNLLIGRDEFLIPLIQASLSVESASHIGPSAVAEVRIRNHSDATYILNNSSPFTMRTSGDVLTLKPNGTTTLFVKTLEQKASFDLTFEVLNALNAPGSHPEIEIQVEVD